MKANALRRTRQYCMLVALGAVVVIGCRPRQPTFLSDRELREEELSGQDVRFYTRAGATETINVTGISYPFVDGYRARQRVTIDLRGVDSVTVESRREGQAAPVANTVHVEKTDRNTFTRGQFVRFSARDRTTTRLEVIQSWAHFVEGWRAEPAHVDLREVTRFRRVQHAHWTIPTTVGYGAFGSALGVAALFAANPSLDSDSAAPAFALPLVGLIAGLGAGIVLGTSAEQTLARDETLGLAHRWAVRAGTVFAGTALGVGTRMAVAPNGSSEGLFHAGAIGTLGGVLLQFIRDDQLHPPAAVHLRHAATTACPRVEFRYRF